MKNSGFAAVLSFFISGLGTIYNGKIGKGLGIILIQTIFVGISLVFSLFYIFVFFLWILSIIDAYKEAEGINNTILREKSEIDRKTQKTEAVKFYSENKVCPMCGEYIKNSAKVCRFCNFDLENGNNMNEEKFSADIVSDKHSNPNKKENQDIENSNQDKRAYEPELNVKQIIVEKPIRCSRCDKLNYYKETETEIKCRKCSNIIQVKK